jgi:serine/threonine protein kinase/formylglycine-generating enzyme required for sulfatase activity
MLLSQMAVRFGFLNSESREKALGLWRVSSGTRSFADVLLGEGFLGETDLEMLTQIVAQGTTPRPGEVDTAQLQPALGSRLGEFRIIRQIARGSMGVVYEAIQEPLNRLVALKVLPSELTRDDRTIERFRREAGAAASLNHPGIVKVLSVGEENGFHFYAMDMVRGQSLDVIMQEVITKEERLPFLRAAEIVREAALALDYAHVSGVVHRDIKPGNIMVTKEGKVLIGDFGLARLETTGTLTRMDEIVGTPMYMSPEQAMGDREKVGARTDIYSLGATLYEALTLSPPFEGADLHQILAQVIGMEPRLPRAINRRIPKDLETICLKAMEKDPEHRYATARGLADDLSRFLRGDPIHARPPSLPARIIRKARRNKSAAALLVMLCLSTVGLAVFLLARHLHTVQTIRSHLTTALEARNLGEEAFREKMKALTAVAEIEARIGRFQDSLEKSELLDRIDRLQSAESKQQEIALANYRGVLRSDPLQVEANEGVARILLQKAETQFFLAKRTAAFEKDPFAGVNSLIAEIERHDLRGDFRVEVASMNEYIERTGTLSIDSRPQGARVSLARVDREGKFDPGVPVDIGTTPLVKDGVKPGSYLLSFALEGFLPITVPVFVGHEHQRPALAPVELFRPEELPEDLVYIPGGGFHFGGRVDGAARGEWKFLPPFFLGIKEITFEEYLRFLNGRAEEVAGWTMGSFLPQECGVEFIYDGLGHFFRPPKNWEEVRRLPVWGIPLEGAKDYCVWKSERSLIEAQLAGKERYLEYRLPTEEEWEKGARGTDGRLYPWGDDFDESRCPSRQSQEGSGAGPSVVPGGRYPGGASPYRLLDMAGNVAEWTATLDQTGREVIVKGGDVNSGPNSLRSPARRPEFPKTRRMIGFRVAAEFKQIP